MELTAVITGASGGIGRAMVHMFAAAGYRVFCGSFSHLEPLETLTAQLRGQGLWAEAFQADLSSSQQADTFAQKVLDRCGGRVDVLVNNAGVAQQKLFQDISDADWRRIMGVNLDGVFYVTRAFLPAMIREKAGRIINISSIWGVCGASCEVHYSASKAAVAGMTKALAKEVGPSGIQVNCIAPGAVETDMNAALDEAALRSLREETPLGRLGTPREIAAAIAFLASEESDFITGQVLSPNGGLVI